MILVHWPCPFGRTQAQAYSGMEDVPKRYLRPEWKSTIVVLDKPTWFLETVEDARKRYDELT